MIVFLDRYSAEHELGGNEFSFWHFASEAKPLSLLSPAERPHWGLAIRVPDPLRPPSEAVTLREALRSAGLAFTVIVGAADRNIELLVTERNPE